MIAMPIATNHPPSTNRANPAGTLDLREALRVALAQLHQMRIAHLLLVLPVEALAPSVVQARLLLELLLLLLLPVATVAGMTRPAKELRSVVLVVVRGPTRKWRRRPFAGAGRRGGC